MDANKHFGSVSSALISATTQMILDRRTGQSIYYKKKEMVITDKTISRNESGICETQFTLEGKGSTTSYLLYTTTDTDSKAEWILTRETSLSTFFPHRVLPVTPPSTLSTGKANYKFQKSYTLDSKDDDGKYVKKTTWDYFDESHSKNLAFENWHESDGNYPEAYIGDVVSINEFSLPDKEPFLKRFSIKNFKFSQSLGSDEGGWVWIILAILFFGLIAIPFDYVLCAAPAIVLIILAFFRFTKQGLTLTIGIWLTFTLILSTLFWNRPEVVSILIVTILFSTLGPRLILKNNLTCKSPPAGCFVLYGIFPVIWIYSFAVYFRFAPSPHTSGDLWAATELPLIIGGICYVFDLLLEKTWLKAD